MYPIIFEYNGLVISSYGFMLMIAFITCNFLLKKYLKSINVNPVIGDDLIFYAAIGGIVGAHVLSGMKAAFVRKLLIVMLFLTSLKLLSRGIEGRFNISIPFI